MNTNEKLLSCAKGYTVFINEHKKVWYHTSDRKETIFKEIPIENVIHVECGMQICCLITQNGELWAFGDSTQAYYGYYRDFIPIRIKLPNCINSVSCSDEFIFAIDSDSKVHRMKVNHIYYELTNTPISTAYKFDTLDCISNAIHVFTGLKHFYVICENGKIYFGEDDKAKISLITQISDVIKIIPIESQLRLLTKKIDCIFLTADGSAFYVDFTSSFSKPEWSRIEGSKIENCKIIDVLRVQESIILLTDTHMLFKFDFAKNTVVDHEWTSKVNKPVKSIFGGFGEHYFVLDGDDRLWVLGVNRGQFGSKASNKIVCEYVPEKVIPILVIEALIAQTKNFTVAKSARK